jgi:hypothetical protein
MVTSKDSPGANKRGAQGHRQAQPSVRAWVAAGTIDAHGARCDSPQNGALTIVAVSVNETCTSSIEERIALMHDVVRIKRLPEGVPSLWVYPGGYFGFNAAAYSNGDGSPAWPGVAASHVEAKLGDIVKAHPVGAWVAFGVDLDVNVKHQQAWLIRNSSTGSGARLEQYKIKRGETSLAERCFDLDGNGLKAAFFVCSEIAAYEDQLSECRLVVDLAHVRVPGTVYCDHAGTRMLHQREFDRVSAYGAAVLAHHHIGELTTAGTEHFRHQSNWILFRGGVWLDSADVEAIR